MKIENPETTTLDANRKAQADVMRKAREDQARKDELRAQFQRLKQLAPEMNRLADEAANKVREIEDAFTKEGLAVPARVLVRGDQVAPDVCDSTKLAFLRLKGKFRIAVVKERHTDYPDEHGMRCTATETIDETPWLECPRDVKLQTFPKLPELLKKIVENAEQSIKAIQEAKPVVDAVLQAMS